MFTAIKINDTNYKFKTWSLETEINWLNKINIFVWQNNSWKSRFMRSIFSKEIFFKTNEFKKTKDFLLTTWKEISDWCKNMWFWRNFPYWEELKVLWEEDYFSEWKHIYSKIHNILEKINVWKNISDSRIWNLTIWQVNKDIEEKYNSKVSEFNFEKEKINFWEYKKVYIPMLRWLKNPIPNEFKKDLYKERTYYDYFLTTKNKDQLSLELDDNNSKNIGFEIFTWLSLYEDIKKMLLWTHEKRENIREFEKFLSKNFFQDKQITLTPNIESDVLDVKIWGNSDLPIYDLWDWIQSIIINTFPLFKYKDENLLLFIEEPEIWIHPWMQRILLNTFAKWIQNEWKEHQIYFTTHSNHFLDIALDKEINEKISVYQFKETDIEKEKYITNISQNKEILDLLWVKNSSIFLSNCIIWVEWVSDRIYIKKFLELYQNQDWKKKFEEDKHFSIIEYAGWNITHFNFWEFNDEDTIKVDAINKNNFIVADNDLKTSWKKFDRLNELKSLIWSDNIYFNFPEIENLITYDIYEKYFDTHKWKNWQKKTLWCWSKSTFEKNIYKKNIWTLIKKTFIELIPGKTSDNFINGNDISIIWKKDEIAERLICFMENYSDLSSKAQELTEKLYTFIEKNNN